ncbi:MAG: inositol monophosphatase [Rhodobiaceae bacterium]|nr:inositol monophosphatase [Rhodobiaceae bacterium]
MTRDYTERRDFAVDLARRAGALALDYRNRLGTLTVENKAPQDFVTEADRGVERLIEEAFAARYPDDAMLGEEYGLRAGTSGYTWVVDPIDGTANFVTGNSIWCVSIACFHEDKIVVGVTYAPVSGDMYAAALGAGTTLNGQPVRVREEAEVTAGSIGVGYPQSPEGRPVARMVVKFCGALIEAGGAWIRQGAGALMLAEVAAGRLLGAAEPHMKPWDCLAGLLMITEAGGTIEPYDGATILQKGTRVIVGGPNVYGRIREIALDIFDA